MGPGILHLAALKGSQAVLYVSYGGVVVGLRIP